MSLPTINPLDGSPLPYAHTRQVLEANFAGLDVLPAWLESTQGTVSFAGPSAGGYVEITTDTSVSDVANLRVVGGIDPSYFRHFRFELNGLSFHRGDGASGHVWTTYFASNDGSATRGFNGLQNSNNTDFTASVYRQGGTDTYSPLVKLSNIIDAADPTSYAVEWWMHPWKSNVWRIEASQGGDVFLAVEEEIPAGNINLNLALQKRDSTVIGHSLRVSQARLILEH